MTYKELIEAMQILVQNIGNQETKVQKKLLKIHTKLKSYYEEYEEQLNDIRLENAMTEENGALILDEKGGYKYNKDGQRKMYKEIKELLSKDFDYQKIEVVNDKGLEEHIYLKDFVNGVKFTQSEEE
jgi:hydroxymethylpyrimidine pyrophosphatase-like HAD family hydrolase